MKLIDELKQRHYPYEIVDGKVIVTHGGSVYLFSVKIVENAQFDNNGSVHLCAATKVKNVQFNNSDFVGIYSATKIENVHFNNGGGVEQSSLKPDAKELGKHNRSIVIFKSDKGLETMLGCFRGTLEECVDAIRRKYGEGSEYERKLTYAFIRKEKTWTP